MTATELDCSGGPGRRKHYSEPITPGVPPPDAEDPEAARGLICRKCGCRHFRVIYTRQARAGRILRRRQCRHCGERLSTVEKPADATPPEPD